MYTVTNINHWLVSLPSFFTTQPLTVLIPAVVTVFCLFLTSFFLRSFRYHNASTNNRELDSPIIQKNTQYIVIRNKRLRIVHIIHELGSKIPLVVFIHGLGGQVTQWENQIEYFSLTANILAVDLLGCGKSEVSYRSRDYTTESLIDDLEELLKRYPSENTVLICHSFGCCLGTKLYERIKHTIKALAFISVKAIISESEKKKQQKVLSYPNFLINIFRYLDRVGGIHSQSVNRILYKYANEEVRTKQLRWNKQSKTIVWKHMLAGMNWFTQADISLIECPMLLITGSEDKISLPGDMNIIQEWCKSSSEIFYIPESGHNVMVEKPDMVNLIINDFLINTCGLETLDPALQILFKTKGENKWSMKNFQKWKRTPIISKRTVNNSRFRAMKVMRQNDEEHCPKSLIAKHPEIGFIIDITKDPPPYRTSDFDNSHITYIKLSTLSKVPPSLDDIQKFIKVANEAWSKMPDKQIAVHCHYGFNRTGFMICCYLIEELHHSVTDALRIFEEARPPGIR
ncbi:1369_t:CDS:10 [Funneliformis caledonium]|uniref:1369_t:CDS:1 n=1 Tax=Funneliformis caledonium TaxID=1117310 RepID=A0A9N8VV40_9GLOM|nr:1369_t:CDS:10 [Funneliformis caledonium]